MYLSLSIYIYIYKNSNNNINSNGDSNSNADSDSTSDSNYFSVMTTPFYGTHCTVQPTKPMTSITILLLRAI